MKIQQSKQSKSLQKQGRSLFIYLHYRGTLPIDKQIIGLLAMTAPCWPGSAGQNGLGVAYNLMKTNAGNTPLTQLQKQAKRSCLSPADTRCSALAVTPLTSAMEADEPQRRHPTPPRHDGVHYTDRRVRDGNGNGARSSTATERTLITVIIS